MAETLTPQQKQAVENRGGKLLVSAAAGSGKTKVLVDRLMRYLTDPADPANLDDFLLITYTKAAAAELRGKIAAKLAERIAEAPGNRHLQQQMQRLYLAKISTVHAFCGDLLREYAYRLDLPADFRVADENECAELRSAAMEQVLEQAYDRAGDDPDFCAFADSQGLGRDDRLVPEILLKVYDSARCHLDPEKWLARCLDGAETEGITDAGQTVWGRYLTAALFDELDRQITSLQRCADAAARTGEMGKPAALLESTLLQLRTLRQSGSWDEIRANGRIDYGRLAFSKKNPDPLLAEQIKAVRAACKKSLETALRRFSDPSERVLEDLRRSGGAVRGMVGLVRQFSEAYEQAKKRRRILDFGDLEHRTLDLLYGRSRTGLTAAAAEIGSWFREIMVDEYQDTNAVQDAIFSALTAKRQNCFLVGDVKQSIYQFRLADPGIFLQKYETYVPAEAAAPGEGRKILLSSNFRSGGAVLDAVNDVFADCMSPEIGGLRYGEDERLREGIPHVPLGEPEVELYALTVREDTYAEEAAFTARRIRQLLDGTHMVRQGETLRPIRPEDIAVLLRSPGSVGAVYEQALAAEGIRCASSGGVNLLETPEIATLRALLQTVSNPRQDIPLAAVLASPVFAFTAEDLARMRAGCRTGSLYEALCAWDSPKSIAFRQTLDTLRRAARLDTLAGLLERIFALTRMDSLYGAMEGGAGRRTNLQLFYQLAVDFENGSRRDLEQFLDHLQALEAKGLMTASEQAGAGCVTLMSIHKSKGLEFPVVFLGGLSREFNRESQRAQVLCDRELGLGLSAVDLGTRVRYPTAAKRAIAVKSAAESLSEELRVLYVAMTRARDRLIMTYAGRNLPSELGTMALRLAKSDPVLLAGDVVCPGEWVLLSALRRTEAGALTTLAGCPVEGRVRPHPWKIEVTEAPAPEEAEALPVPEEKPALPPETAALLGRSLAFAYPYPAATRAPSKQTATAQKGREKDEEAAEQAPAAKAPRRTWRRPGFAGAEPHGKAYGTAVHGAMQYLRFACCGSRAGIEAELHRLVEQRFLSPEQGAIVPADRLAAFFETPLGKKLCTGGKVLREFKFSVLEDGKTWDPALEGEKILLQGVVDCALLEDDGITVLDFKTDFVTEDTLSAVTARYAPQVNTYAAVLARIYRLPVKQKLLYFFHLNCFSELPMIEWVKRSQKKENDI